MKTFILLIALVALLIKVDGHGRLMVPINRSSIWRDPQFAHLNPPSNWQDDQHYCGGFHNQWNVNGGRCGPCGDSWSQRVPRENENTGIYGRGIVVGNYTRGQVINVQVHLTAEHMGHFEFRLCVLNNASAAETNECFSNLLQKSDGSGTKFPIDQGIGMYYASLRLPAGVTCNRCVLQWHYRTGNAWGECDDGSEGMGCGPQETFRSCSDISIR